MIGVAFSADGRRAVLQTFNAGIRLWDVENGKELRRLESQESAWCMAFSPDNRRVAYTSGLTIRLWDIDSGKEIRRFEGHKEPVTAVAFSPVAAGCSPAASTTR